jgi:hypothetical protein
MMFPTTAKDIAMKKMVQILLLGIFLAGCSSLPQIDLPQLLGTPTPPEPIETPTPFASETPIPTQNLFATSTPTPLTFTPTVTMIGAELFTPTRTPTAGLPTSTPGLPPAAALGSYFTPQDTGFTLIMYSGSLLYWNEGPCMPRNIKISAFVEDLINTDKVLLFMRLRDKKDTLHLSKWGSPAIMVKGEDGSFNYNIRTFNLDDYYYFRDAWIEYQLVAYTEEMQEIGRTKIYDRNIGLARCRP